MSRPLAPDARSRGTVEVVSMLMWNSRAVVLSSFVQ